VKPTLDPAEFNIGNFRNRRKRTDPWAQFFKSRENLKTAVKQLERL
jgi:DNA primase